MDLIQFEIQIRQSLIELSYVKRITIIRRTPISIKGLIDLENNYKIVAFYNQPFSIISFSLLCENERIYGIDLDNRIGWHIHPEENPNYHKPTNAKSISEILILIGEVYCNRN